MSEIPEPKIVTATGFAYRRGGPIKKVVRYLKRLFRKYL